MQVLLERRFSVGKLLAFISEASRNQRESRIIHSMKIGNLGAQFGRYRESSR